MDSTWPAMDCTEFMDFCKRLEGSHTQSTVLTSFFGRSSTTLNLCSGKFEGWCAYVLRCSGVITPVEGLAWLEQS